MKRVSLSIKSRSHPDVLCIGYALTTELTEGLMTFFSTQKFPIDEELEITTHLQGKVKVFHVIMKTLREEISSGKIMNALPDENSPFPARTFYKCYAKNVVAQAQVVPQAEAEVAPEAPQALDEPKAA